MQLNNMWFWKEFAVFICLFIVMEKPVKKKSSGDSLNKLNGPYISSVCLFISTFY